METHPEASARARIVVRGVVTAIQQQPAPPFGGPGALVTLRDEKSDGRVLGAIMVSDDVARALVFGDVATLTLRAASAQDTIRPPRAGAQDEDDGGAGFIG